MTARKSAVLIDRLTLPVSLSGETNMASRMMPAQGATMLMAPNSAIAKSMKAAV